jgi:uroporphyrinogen-III synthase
MGAHPHIVLFRDPEEREDPYEELFREAGFHVQSVPLLRFEAVGHDRLRRALLSGEYAGGLIVTSPRAAEVLVEVAGETGFAPGHVFVVGPRTADIVRRGGMEPRGAHAGRGEELARYIIHNRPPGKMLFLAGDRRMDAVPTALAEAGLPFEELTVYETHLRERVEVEGRPDWVVFFSPSGVEAAHIQGLLPTDARIAAIGPTSAADLRLRGFQVAGEAANPDPASLLEAVRAASG